MTEGLSSPEIIVRTMRADEKPAVRRIAFRAFSLLARIFFSWSDTVLVAEGDGKLLGGAVLETFDLGHQRKAGFVAWIFADPTAQGIGVGQRLIEAALAHFEAEGCDEVLAGVEGHNTSSSKLFATRGFGILSPAAQWRRYGWRLPLVWWHTFHVMDVGHFLWGQPPATGQDSPAAQWGATLLANILLAWIGVRAWGAHSWLPWLAAATATVVLLGVRWFGMLLAARAQGLQVRYRAWESGFPLSLAIALLFRGLYPVTGGLYPQGHEWRYRELMPQLGRMALAGVAGPLALLWLAWGLSGVPAVSALLPYVYYVGIPLIVVDVLAPFFPLACYNGRRLWDWSRPVWVVAAALVVALIAVA